MNNRSMMFFFALFICFLFTGCESGSQSSEDGVLEINIAHGNQPTEPIGQMAEKWRELVEEESNGQVQLNIYPSSQLGSEKDVVEQAIMGNNVIIFTGYDFLMDYVPDAGILTAPFLTEDIDTLLALTESDWFYSLEDDLQAKGIEIINTSTVYGERQLMTDKLIESPEDLRGLKIRVPNNQMYIKTFQAFGASPTPMPLSDTYTSLQQGLIDGAENPLPVLAGSKTNEVTNYLTLTGHTKIISPWIAGTDFIDTLPAETVELLKETSLEAAAFARDIIESEEESVLQEFEEQGIEINMVDIEPFREQSQSVYTAFPDWSDGLYETVHSLIEEYEAQNE
ncbi:C4-dicarboxylate TRAP transporter substrate-binding protein [Gracilibacillus alcaliphilus]|uniref:C4-dicarboxylate TRAP transporter substrate-binding protein n=1 Tax=Gracilibacillus alcaliphilus TaxID=1401441 RepID=UPI0019577A44|nr:C4-dicarboxylate TRAP transporter substrate-binding protein [Gracilibacillus alcaliphilus]MBM7676453.1 tripartite ATP-independent transporter DctP family solute receptor [Gracilibacillus alcaliphilus]